MKKRKLIIFGLIVSAILVGCSGKPSPQADQRIDAQSYPVSDYTDLIDPGYPVDGADSTLVQGPVFTILTPVNASDKFVHGTGPAGVPIILISVSDVGDVLGETTIEPDGSFLFVIEEPLTPGQMIGLQLGDITGTDFVEADFLFSDTYFERPFIGILFDLVVVE